MRQKTPIAVVGMAGIFPGAPNLDIFWQNIVNKVDTTDKVPKDRWIAEPDAMYAPLSAPDKAISKRACLIRDFEFDPKGIDIDTRLLEALDPLYRIVLHAGRHAFSSCVTSSLNKDRVGVALAAIALPTDSSSAITREILGKSFEQRLFSEPETGNRKPETRISRDQGLASRVTGLPGALLAKGLGLGGGTFTLDAACASSLYALNLACDELRTHRVDAMLAGGASRPECLYTQVGFSQLQALSPSGRCAPFDARGDGLVVGEGAGILVLKRLEDALDHGDTIYGVIRGIGLSNDMRGNLLAPETRGQVRAMESAYKAAGWIPCDVDHIECHGAGTRVGDITELHSLKALWGDSGWSPGQCAIGSVKSMIGHLLTGAGAAGMIKTLLALKHKTLPPSLNFQSAPENSPLNGSPFRVQTQPEEWKQRDPDTPRRAAISSFGFGGINAHLLIESPQPTREAYHIPRPTSLVPPCPIAIVGMETVFGELRSLKAFQEALLNGRSVIRKRPENRWKGCDALAEKILEGRGSYGGYMDDLSLYVGEFHIPPNEIPDILPQQLLMLKVSAKAMKDAGLPLREERPRMGTVIGMEFDFEATNFHLRWNLHNEVRKWRERFDLDDKAAAAWLDSLRDACGPPLTANRTVGALGGIVASRVAREFCFGGPSFVVSGEAASGLKALEIGVRFLQQNEMDAVLVGAIDLAGDVRNVITSDAISPFAKKDEIRPFDPSAEGTLPGEGAAALVIKRLDQAIRDGDRIYSVIRGFGKASAKGMSIGESQAQVKDAYARSLGQAFQSADVPPASVSYVETHGSANPTEDAIEAEALHEFFNQASTVSDPPAGETGHSKSETSAIFEESERFHAIGSVKATIGHAGAAAGLASVVKTSLCLHQEIIPPIVNLKLETGNADPVYPKSCFQFPVPSSHSPVSTFHLPAYPQFWLRDRKEGPRRACVASMTLFGDCSHVILEGVEYESVAQIPEPVTRERKRPTGLSGFGLFVVEGNTRDELAKGLNALEAHISASEFRNLELAARAWYLKNKLDYAKKYAVSIISVDPSLFEKRMAEARAAIASDSPEKMNGPFLFEGGQGGVSFSPHPLGGTSEIAFVFPGSGNHYVGMGRGMGVYWPEILREMDEETLQLRTQMIPDCYVPWRNSWPLGWEREAYQKNISDPLYMIFGQVVHGGVVANLVRSFGIRASAMIGYSLGECAGLFAMGVWPERGEMLERMSDTNVFTTELAGPCHAARKAWNIPQDEDIDNTVAVVNRPADVVREVIAKWPFTRLLIINTPDQCVIGGQRNQVESVIRSLRCQAVFLEGVVTVHSDAARPVADAYKALHIFPTTPPKGVRFYSCAFGRSYHLTSESAASSILQQALSGFDFNTTVNQAYEDGVRIFLEMGPQSSCTKMISRILDTKPHLAVSADVRGEDDHLTMLKFLGALIAERVPVDLDKLYGDDACQWPTTSDLSSMGDKRTMIIGGKPPSPRLPIQASRESAIIRPSGSRAMSENASAEAMPRQEQTARPSDPAPVGTSFENERQEPEKKGNDMFSELISQTSKNIEATAEAHKMFLEFSDELIQNFGKTFAFQTQLMESMGQGSGVRGQGPGARDRGTEVEDDAQEMRGDGEQAAYDEQLRERMGQPVAFDRDMCMEFAIGSLGKVLGPEFAVVDSYDVRVRLPDEPLMLVDRILSVEGEKGSLGSGRLVTEHDVLPGAWYLDGDRTPVCVSVEAGQADLFLCSYLGIDLAVKGKRAYRLLDAAIRFHRGLPRPGDVIRYEIEIEKFVRQGETYLFLFSFEGFIGNEHLITMRNGCAGFFTEEEVRNSGGIILTQEDTRAMPGKKDFDELVPLSAEAYDDEAVDALRRGDLGRGFGDLFKGVRLAESLWLPGGQMKLLNRILLLDPEGGRYGLGMIRAEADIHPDDWFLTCHFMDDMVMPGTLMYECCAHTLRVLLQRMGWVTEKPGVCYEPAIGVESVLKCRGPVTPKTKHVTYEVEINEIGYAPEPYVIADALMCADGRRVVKFKDMSMKMTGITREEIEDFWAGVRGKGQGARGQGQEDVPLFDRDRILAFAIGKPSEAFGEPYNVFDGQRRIARLPGPPYAFMDRVTHIEPEPWVLKAGGWIEAEYDVPGDEWYFQADRSGAMPFCVLLEIALQPCGWLAAYLGSALRSETDLKFRNLGGNAVLHRNILPESKTLTMRSRMTQVSESGGMIIENFDMQVLQEGEMIYEGDTNFGFFTKEALGQQIGIRGAKEEAYMPTPDEVARGHSYWFEDEAPLFPDDPNIDPGPALGMPAKALRMIDEIEIYVRDGGPRQLGFIRGIKNVDPEEWFFKAHFYQDPVCPGSLGIESFVQLMKFMAIDRWKDLVDSHRFEMVTERAHHWIYRGQVIQANKTVEVEAVVTEIQEEPVPTIFANGYLKVDGLFIYQMEDFGLRLVPAQK